MSPATRLASDRRRSGPSRPTRPGGFTLIEMLVTLGLVGLLLGIVASVFVGAAGAVSTHRSRSKMDQRVRAIALVINRDLRQMFLTDEKGGWPPTPPVSGGHFCYGEGDQADVDTHADTDDWAQWSANAPMNEWAAVEAGKATDNDMTLPRNAAGDGKVQTSVYEVAYHLRPDPRGTGRFILYRKTHLLGAGAQPRARQGDSLLHESTADVWPWPLYDIDVRDRRWAFTSSETPSADSSGFRPSLAQTSDATNWPRPYDAAPSAWDPATYSGNRRGLDILSMDVLSFDIKFWDRYANPVTVDGETYYRGAFVDVHAGNTAAVEWRSDGAYAGTGYARIFDTWSTDYNFASYGEQVPYSYDPATGNHQPAYTAGASSSERLADSFLRNAQFPRAIQIKVRLADPYGSDLLPAREVTVVVDMTKR